MVEIKLSSLYICQNDTIAENSCYNPLHVAKGRRTQEKSENYICICCAVLREPTIFHERRAISAKRHLWEVLCD